MKTLILLLALLLAPCLSAAKAGDTDYVQDIEFALEELEDRAGHFFKNKNIDWKKVAKQFKKEAKAVETDQEHLVLLVRLMARLKDGHARVNALPAGEDVKWPEEPKRTGPGMFWVHIGKKIYVKNTWNAAKDAGVKPGMEIVKVDGVKAADWLAARTEEIADKVSFSTPQQADFYACHWGLQSEVGSRMKLEVKLAKKKKKKTISFSKSSAVPWGPAFFPKNMQSADYLTYGKTARGFGYVHIRRCKGDISTLMDQALAKVGDAPGLILDFRANGGGGFDHDEFLGRFIPKGKNLSFVKSYASTGANPYGGPIVVIIDGNTRSAGETASGIFKEDGRAYMIGESPTAGMSAGKQTLELPSGLFSLYFAVSSNKGRFNNGRGIEGIGVIPHEIVEYLVEDLYAEEDTLIKRAEALLEDFPQKEVPYDPAKFDWKQ